MSDIVIVALISSGLTLLGTILTLIAQDRKRQAEQEKHEALQDQKMEAFEARTNEKIEDLTIECRRHNQVKERVYQAEQDIAVIKEQVKVANHRIEDLERKTA